MSKPKLTVYYDGLCPLCSREIAHYRKHMRDDSVDFEDITELSFDSATQGLDPRAIHRIMHVKTASGQIKTGLDAFIALWLAIPAYRWLGRVAGLPVVHGVMSMIYRLFAQCRPWLPRRKRADCPHDSCSK